MMSRKIYLRAASRLISSYFAIVGMKWLRGRVQSRLRRRREICLLWPLWILWTTSGKFLLVPSSSSRLARPLIGP